MAVDLAADARPGRFTQGRLAFRRWRRNRPFWGGFFMIVSGLVLFGSGNLQPKNFQIHLGVEGFLGYLVPAIMILCGALLWATPAQRIFYGILGVVAALYSLISVNLGGFLLGMLLGVIGGSLAVAWVPVKAPKDGPDDGSEAGGGPGAGDGSGTGEADAMAATATTAEARAEGKQGARFPGPRHAAASLGVNRTAVVIVTALAITAAVGFVALRDPAPAAAATCTTPSLTQIVKSAKPKIAKKVRKPSSHAHADGLLAGGHDSASSATSGGIVGGLLGGLARLLSGRQAADASASPSTSPTPTPTQSPKPTPTPTQSPKPPSSPTPTHSRAPSPGTSSATPPTAAPSPSAPSPSAPSTCAIVARRLAAAADQVKVEEVPSIQTTALLTMTGVSYVGNVNLPTASGTISVMEFTMDSSTSKPFELDITLKGHLTKVKSSKLTVSGHVQFYATEIKGNALGILPQDYTPSNPPPLVPPDVFFTDVTIGLVDVQCDSLTADGFSVT